MAERGIRRKDRKLCFGSFDPSYLQLGDMNMGGRYYQVLPNDVSTTPIGTNSGCGST